MNWSRFFLIEFLMNFCAHDELLDISNNSIGPNGQNPFKYHRILCIDAECSKIPYTYCTKSNGCKSTLDYIMVTQNIYQI